MDVKVIFSDLDGTLLNSSSALSSENSAAISEIVKRGILFVPTTGRTLAEIPLEVMNHKDIKYIIYSNGAGIYDKENDKRYENLLSEEKIKEIIAILFDYDLLYLIHKDGFMYLDNDRYPAVDNYRALPVYKKLFTLIPEEYRINNYKEYLRGLNNAEMIIMFYGNDERRESELAERLSEISKLHVTSSAVGNLEIVSDKANKKNAISIFLDNLGLSRGEIITVGDSTNDIEMLEFAERSFAVSGARDIVKASASEVICGNDEHVAEYILKNIL